jgi:hypothetical protein
VKLNDFLLFLSVHKMLPIILTQHREASSDELAACIGQLFRQASIFIYCTLPWW